MTPLRLARRYGQDEIEEMLIAKGGRDEVDQPSAKKISTGVEPPWVTRDQYYKAYFAVIKVSRNKS